MLAASGGESDGYLGWWGCPEADATQACAAKGAPLARRSRYFTAKRPTVWWLSVGRGPRRLEGHGRVPIIVYNNSVYILKLEQKTVVPDQIKAGRIHRARCDPGLAPTTFHAAEKLERASRAFSRRHSGGQSPRNGRLSGDPVPHCITPLMFWTIGPHGR